MVPYTLRILRRLNSLGPVTIRLRPYSEQQVVISKKKKELIKISKKPCRPPFMKNIFQGVFDKEMLLYPELDKTSLQELKETIKPHEQYIKDNVDPSVVSSLHIIPSEVKEHLKDLGLFGQLIPEVYGGSEQSATETALISELIAKDLDVALTLYSHNFLGAQTLVLFGSDEQKAKYLPQLASGEKIAAFCFSENVSSSDPSNFTATLEKSDDSNMFMLNGKKQWVTNGNNADLFIVVAKWSVRLHTAKKAPVVRLLIVERDSPGITVSSPVEHVGLNASNLCEVSFDNTPVTSDCLIQGELQGFDQCVKILNSGRYNIGAMTLSVLKNLLSKASNFIVGRKQFLKPLNENELVQKKCASIAECIYTLESMTYHTAAILDNYEDPDVSLELSIIKVFSFTEGRHCLDLLMELMGGRAYLNSEITQKYFRDFRTMEMFDGTTDIAKLFISLVGLQHAGVAKNETVSKMRFPFEYPEYKIKSLFANRRQMNDNPKLNLKLYEQLHPALTDSANLLEYCALRLEFAVPVLLGRFGSETVDEQLDLMRLANAAVKIYAMTCVLGRASRSYCIGLRNAEAEIKYAISICSRYKKEVQSELNDLLDGCFLSGDERWLQQGSDILKHKGYFCEHPLERSY